MRFRNLRGHSFEVRKRGDGALQESDTMSLSLFPSHDLSDAAKECTDYARARKLIELILAQSAVIMARPTEKDIEGSYQVNFFR